MEHKQNKLEVHEDISTVASHIKSPPQTLEF